MYIHVVYIIVHPYTRNARLPIPWDRSCAQASNPVAQHTACPVAAGGSSVVRMVREYESTRDESTTGKLAGSLLLLT